MLALSAIRRELWHGRPWRCDRARGAVWDGRRRRCDRAAVRRGARGGARRAGGRGQSPGPGCHGSAGLRCQRPSGRPNAAYDTSAHAYTAALSERLPYDPIADFVPVAAVTSQAYVLVANPSAGFQRLADLARAGRTRPGGLSFVSAERVPPRTCALPSSAVISVSARATSRLERRTGSARRSRVSRQAKPTTPYRPFRSPHPISRPAHSSAIGVTATRRSPLLPAVPTLAEVGAEGFDFPSGTDCGRQPRPPRR